MENYKYMEDIKYLVEEINKQKIELDPDIFTKKCIKEYTEWSDLHYHINYTYGEMSGRYFIEKTNKTRRNKEGEFYHHSYSDFVNYILLEGYLSLLYENSQKRKKYNITFYNNEEYTKNSSGYGVAGGTYYWDGNIPKITKKTMQKILKAINPHRAYWFLEEDDPWG